MAEKTYLAKRLRDARKAAGLTLAQAGDAVEKSSKTISAYEAAINEPSVDTLIGLCEAYKVDVSYFFIKLDNIEDDYDISARYKALSEQGKEMVRDYIDMVAKCHPKSDDDD